MTDDTLYERFKRIDLPRHRKFYELDVELTLFYPKMLIRRWGKIGTRRPRELCGVYPTPEALRDAITQTRQRRRRHGYHRVRARHGGQRTRPFANKVLMATHVSATKIRRSEL